MSTAITMRGTLRRSACLAIAGSALLAAVHGAAASDDAGVHEFFAAIFGGNQPQSQPAATAAPAPSRGASPAYAWSRPTRSHALTVRLHPAKPRTVLAQVPIKPEKVSIFEDRTLRRGDAVMTARGVRVFAGSNAWPYSEGDFVSLDDAKQFNTDTSKVLAQLDRMPRG